MFSYLVGERRLAQVTLAEQERVSLIVLMYTRHDRLNGYRA
jgi:hypothetical protein